MLSVCALCTSLLICAHAREAEIKTGSMVRKDGVLKQVLSKKRENGVKFFFTTLAEVAVVLANVSVGGYKESNPGPRCNDE